MKFDTFFFTRYKPDQAPPPIPPLPNTPEASLALLTRIESNFPLGWGVILARRFGFIPHAYLDYESRDVNALVVVSIYVRFVLRFVSFFLCLRRK